MTNIKWIFQINLYYTIANLFQYEVQASEHPDVKDKNSIILF